MAKANSKAQKKAPRKNVVQELARGFSDYEEVFDMLIEQSEQMGMSLLIKSIELSKAILQTYKKAWIMKAKEKN